MAKRELLCLPQAVPVVLEFVEPWGYKYRIIFIFIYGYTVTVAP